MASHTDYKLKRLNLKGQGLLRLGQDGERESKREIICRGKYRKASDKRAGGNKERDHLDPMGSAVLEK